MSISQWSLWNRINGAAGDLDNVFVDLVLGENCPESGEEIARVLGEPIGCVQVDTNLFIQKAGSPGLSLTESHFRLLSQLCRVTKNILLSGVSSEHHKESIQQIISAIRGCALVDFRESKLSWDVYQSLQAYNEFLQSPLQPLHDNLEAQTYETFEMDTVKYSAYKAAIAKAIIDLDARGHIQDRCVIFVAGSGRGPIVSAALEAAEMVELHDKVHVYAVEKNKNAIHILEALSREQWGNRVTVVHSDMRDLVVETKADVIVSELLGSFGDNELSPECLDGVQHYLQPWGISIPREYTSYIAPISSPQLWRKVRACGKKAFDIPYVVRLNNFFQLCDAQKVFTFSHPRDLKAQDNSRYGSFSFESCLDATVHGFAGFFDCILYGDVTLSTEPRCHTPNMFSWFPIFFPLSSPLHVSNPRTDALSLEMWRIVNVKSKKVWYEWVVSTAHAQSPIHNSGGCGAAIGL
jgi:protein arginine N-methyltransferase 5